MPANPVVKPDETVRKIMKAAFPEWKGQKVRIEPTAGTLNLSSYWSGGSRDMFAFVRLPDFKSMSVPSQSPFEPQVKGLEDFKMVPGVLVVGWSVFQGKRMTPRIYVHPDNVNQILLPEPEVELTFEEAAALNVSDHYISSARLDYFHKITGLGKREYEAARASLREKGLLKKNNSVTIEGENVASNWRNDFAVMKHYGKPLEYHW